MEYSPLRSCTVPWPALALHLHVHPSGLDWNPTRPMRCNLCLSQTSIFPRSLPRLPSLPHSSTFNNNNNSITERYVTRQSWGSGKQHGVFTTHQFLQTGSHRAHTLLHFLVPTASDLFFDCRDCKLLKHSPSHQTGWAVDRDTWAFCFVFPCPKRRRGEETKKNERSQRRRHLVCFIIYPGMHPLFFLQVIDCISRTGVCSLFPTV